MGVRNHYLWFLIQGIQTWWDVLGNHSCREDRTSVLPSCPYNLNSYFQELLNMTFRSLLGLQGCLEQNETCREGEQFIMYFFLETPTTFSKGAAPNTLKTGLGLEGEMHRTMACCPTLVVYSSSVARSFLKQRHKTVNRYRLKAPQKHDPLHCKLSFLMLPIQKPGEKQSPSWSD